MTTEDVITNAYRELGVIDLIDPLPGEMAAFGLTVLNGLLDLWNAKSRAVYADVLSTFTLTPALNPHTIGPSGTWSLTKRPVELLEDLTLIVGSTYTPITQIERATYLRLSAPATSSAYPKHFYYNPAHPNGAIYFYPVPSAAYNVRVPSRVILGGLALATEFTLPQGYERAVTLSLAEALPFPTPSKLEAHAREARAVVFGNNLPAPKIATADAGMPSRGARTYDYRIGPLS